MGTGTAPVPTTSVSASPAESVSATWNGLLESGRVKLLCVSQQLSSELVPVPSINPSDRPTEFNWNGGLTDVGKAETGKSLSKK